ncbi:hypothetical protein Taro_004422, partial [Colocasia esculenta]|nr:hypothetical protein [Colocasia esculenta]
GVSALFPTNGDIYASFPIPKVFLQFFALLRTFVISHKSRASVQFSGQKGHLCHFPPNPRLFYNVAPFMDFRRWVPPVGFFWTRGGCLRLGLDRRWGTSCWLDVLVDQRWGASGWVLDGRGCLQL